jgi:hypothetical protein
MGLQGRMQFGDRGSKVRSFCRDGAGAQGFDLFLGRHRRSVGCQTLDRDRNTGNCVQLTTKSSASPRGPM